MSLWSRKLSPTVLETIQYKMTKFKAHQVAQDNIVDAQDIRFDSLPNKNFSDRIKLKAFAVDKLNVVEKVISLFD